MFEICFAIFRGINVKKKISKILEKHQQRINNSRKNIEYYLFE